MKIRNRKHTIYGGIIRTARELFPRVETLTPWTTGQPVTLRFTVYESLGDWCKCRRAVLSNKVRNYLEKLK